MLSRGHDVMDGTGMADTVLESGRGEQTLAARY